MRILKSWTRLSSFYTKKNNGFKNKCVQYYTMNQPHVELYNIVMNNIKEENKKRYKEYYETHKHVYCTTTVCECGGTYNTYNKARHLRTKKHLKFVN